MRTLVILTVLGLAQAIPQYRFDQLSPRERSRDEIRSLPVGDSNNGCFYRNVSWICRGGPGPFIINKCQYFNMNDDQCVENIGTDNNFHCEPCCNDPGRLGMAQCQNIRVNRNTGPVPPPATASSTHLEVSSSGGAASYRRMMGTFSKLPGLFKGYPQYQKVGDQKYIFVHDRTQVSDHPVWVMSGTVANNARSFGLYNPTPADPASPFPPTTGWRFWKRSAQDYLDDSTMSVTAVNNEGCAPSNQKGMGCDPSGYCQVWCCEDADQATNEIPACENLL